LSGDFTVIPLLLAKMKHLSLQIL